MTNLRGVAGLWACWVFAGCGSTEPREWEDSPALALRLSPSGEPRRDRVVLKATVTNVSSRPLAWDREFGVHMGWELRDEKGSAIEKVESSTLQKPSPSESFNRFVILKPGQSIAKEFELTGRVQFSLEGHGTFAGTGDGHTGKYHVGSFAERISKFRIPETCKQVNVRVRYQPHDLARGAFIEWFGEASRELPFWDGRVESDQLTLTIP